MLELLHTPITVLHVFGCLMLMLVVLIQPGKSGGLGAALGGAGATQIFGGRGAGNFLTKTTWIAATVFFLTSVTLAYVSTSTGDSLEGLSAAAKAKVEGKKKADVDAVKPGDGAAKGAEPGAPAQGSAAPASGDAPAEPKPENTAPSSAPVSPSDESGAPSPAPNDQH
jgi:preprotein translocase subunit SecG